MGIRLRFSALERKLRLAQLMSLLVVLTHQCYVNTTSNDISYMREKPKKNVMKIQNSGFEIFEISVTNSMKFKYP